MHGIADIRRLNAKAAKRQVTLQNHLPVKPIGYKAGPVNAAPYGLRPYIGANDNA